MSTKQPRKVIIMPSHVRLSLLQFHINFFVLMIRAIKGHHFAECGNCKIHSELDSANFDDLKLLQVYLYFLTDLNNYLK